MRRIALLVLSAAALLLLPCCAPKKPIAGAGAKAAAPSIKVVFLEGEVKIDGAAAELGQQIRIKAVIETGPGASCDIVFDDKNALRVSQNAVASLDFSGIVKEVALKRGGLTAVLRKLEKVSESDSFRVDTSTAVAGVRGTSFCVWADASSTYVCACNGTVRTIDSKGSNSLSLSAPHHLARIYSSVGGKTQVAPAGLEHHSDASVETLAARIGEKLDWAKTDE